MRTDALFSELPMADQAERLAKLILERNEDKNLAAQDRGIAIEEAREPASPPRFESPPGGLRSRLLSSVSSGPWRFAPFVGRLAMLLGVSEKVAERELERPSAPNSWQVGRWPPVEEIALACGEKLGDATAIFVRVRPGTRIPRHRHLGQERWLVLQGECLEDDGTVTRPGDAAVRVKDSEHSVTASGEADLIMAVVQFGGVELLEAES